MINHSRRFLTLAYQVFWWLWYNGILLSGLFLRLLYALLRRQFLPYPSLSELRQYRRELELAEHFSRNVVLRVAASPAMNVKDLWATFKEYRTSRTKVKSAQDSQTIKADARLPEESHIVVDEIDDTKEPTSEEEDIVTSLLEEDHIWGPILHIANRIADIHERIKKYAHNFWFVYQAIYILQYLPMATSSGLCCLWHGMSTVLKLCNILTCPDSFCLSAPS